MNTMRAMPSTPSRALPALLAAVVVAIVLGIVAMHALNTHGVMGNTDHATSSPAGLTATVSTTGLEILSHQVLTGSPADTTTGARHAAHRTAP